MSDTESSDSELDVSTLAFPRTKARPLSVHGDTVRCTVEGCTARMNRRSLAKHLKTHSRTSDSGAAGPERHRERTIRTARENSLARPLASDRRISPPEIRSTHRSPNPKAPNHEKRATSRQSPALPQAAFAPPSSPSSPDRHRSWTEGNVGSSSPIRGVTRTPLSPPPTLVRTELLSKFDLVVLQPYGLLVCVECGRGTPYEHLKGHLRKAHNSTITDAQKDELVLVHKLAAKEELLKQKPKGVVTALPLLTIVDGFACSACPSLLTGAKNMETHLKTHQTGSPVASPVLLQEYIPKNMKGYIQVVRPADSSPKRLHQLVSEEMARNLDSFHPVLVDKSDWRDIHPFMVLSGIADWMDGMTRQDVEKLRELMASTPEIRQDCLTILERATDSHSQDNFLSRCVINSTTDDHVESNAFDRLMTHATRKRYSDTLARLLGFLVRTKKTPDDERRYRLSPNQTAALDRYLETKDDGPRRNAIIHLIASLFMCPFEGLGEHGSPLIPFVFLQTAKETNVIADPDHVSEILASLQYMFRLTVYVLSLQRAQKTARDEADRASQSLPSPAMTQSGSQASSKASQRTSLPAMTQAVNVVPLSQVPARDRTNTMFYIAQEISREWLREKNDSVFSWLRQVLRACTRFQSSSNRIAPFIFNFDVPGQFSFHGLTLNYAQVTRMVHEDAVALSESFLRLWREFDLPESLLLHDLSGIEDDISARAENYSFVNAGRNHRLQSHAEEVRKHIVDSETYFRNVDGSLFPLKSRMQKILDKCEGFLKELAVAMYLQGGQPPRGTELMNTILMNLPTRIRNLLFIHGRFFNVCFYNKTTYIVDREKPIPHMFPHLLGVILANYITFLRPIEHLFQSYTLGGLPEASPSLKKLFFINGKILTTEDLTKGLQVLTRKWLPGCDGYGVADMRQIWSYLSKRYIAPMAGKENVAEMQVLLDHQSGHSSETAEVHYGREEGELARGVDSVTLADFKRISVYHHSECDIETLYFNRVHMSDLASPQTAQRKQRSAGRTADSARATLSESVVEGELATEVEEQEVYFGSTIPDFPAVPAPAPDLANSMREPAPLSSQPSASDLAKVLSQQSVGSSPSVSSNLLLGRPAAIILEKMAPTPPGGFRTSATASTLHTLRKLRKDPEACFKSLEQAEATQFAHDRDEHCLVVMATGAGKTAIVAANAMMDFTSGRVTVMMVPTTSLRDDLVKRFTSDGVPCVEWHRASNEIHALAIVNFESAGQRACINMLIKLCEAGKLARIIIDESHYAMMNVDFRAKMGLMVELSRIPVPMMLLTGTLPPGEEGPLLLFFGLPLSTRVIRMPTVRPNIRYSVVFQKQLKAVDENEHALKMLLDHMSADKAHGRIIVYCQSKALIDWMQEQKPEWLQYHADTPLRDKQKFDELWRADGRNIVLATTSLSYGIDKPDVNWVYHLSRPSGAMDFAQESGRGGRAGQTTQSVVLYWRTPTDREGGLTGGANIMPTFMLTSGCRRLVLQTYLDGTAFNCLSYPKGTAWCDNCERDMESTSGQRHIPGKPVGLAVAISATLAAQALAPPSVEPVRQRLVALRGQCIPCYMTGLGINRGHGWPHCEHVAHLLRVNDFGRDFKDLFRWGAEEELYKEAMVSKTGAVRKLREAVCWKCWLPLNGAVFHEKVQKSGRSESTRSCLYDDILPRTAYLMWFSPWWKPVLGEFLGKHDLTLKDLLLYVLGDDNKGLSRPVRLFMLADDVLEKWRTGPEQESVWSITHALQEGS